MAFISNLSVSNESLHATQILQKLWYAKFEILPLQMTGFSQSQFAYNLGGASAYVSALLICSPIVYCFIRDYTKEFKVIAPIFIIAIYSRILNLYGNLSQWCAYDNILPVGLFRGFAGLCVGAWCYLVFVKRIEKLPLKALNLLLISAVTFSFILFSFGSATDLVLCPFVFGAIISVYKYSGKSIFSKVSVYLGRISYMIFVLHTSIILIMRDFLKSKLSLGIIVLFFTIEICSAIIANFILEKLKYGKCNR